MTERDQLHLPELPVGGKWGSWLKETAPVEIVPVRMTDIQDHVVIYDTGLPTCDLGAVVLDRLMIRRDAVCFSSENCQVTGKVLSEVGVLLLIIEVTD